MPRSRRGADPALGGIETTLRPMCWVWYLLAMHPWAKTRLHAELDAALGGRARVSRIWQKLSYLRQVVDETMRAYPPVRSCCAPSQERTQSAAIRCGMARRSSLRPGSSTAPRLWRDPDRFDPDRFAPDTDRVAVALVPICRLRWARACIAAPLAIMQIHIAVAMLAQRFRFISCPHPVEPVRLDHIAAGTASGYGRGPCRAIKYQPSGERKVRKNSHPFTSPWKKLRPIFPEPNDSGSIFPRRR